LLVTFYDAFLVRRPGRWAAAAYAACAALALYAQYYLAFLIAAQAIALIVYRRGALVRYAATAAVAALAFSPMLAIVPAQVANFRGAFAPPASVLQSATILASIAGRYLFPLLVPHAAIVYLVLGVGVAAALIRFRRAFSPGGNGEILVVTAGAYALFACVAYAAGVHILNRHAASLYIPATLSVYAVLTFLYPRARRRAMLLWCAAAAIASSVALVQTYAQGAKPGDWLRASAYIRAHEHAGEPIVVFEAENALPFAFYYRGPNSVRAVPHAVNFRRYDVTRFVVHNEAELQAAMPRAHRVWFITAGECASANVSFGCDTVERFIAARYRTQLRASFYGSSVRLLRLERGGNSGS
ncbi:MAG TPA: hypothetical protein VGN11_12335, partial [Candidatus Baltobacteraceae bacterium]|nr:hypothetical protein [Candidatus Baltobacteraceae bacterium]